MAGRLTRRRFLARFAAGGAAVAGGAGIGLTLLTTRKGRTGANDRPAQLTGRVVLARDDALTDRDGWVQGPAARRILDAALVRLTGKPTPGKAWRSLFSPHDRVGIKVNCLAGRRLSSQPALVRAIVEGLRSAGVSAERIFVWERSERELERAGFPVRRSGPVRVIATDSPGVGYESEPSSAGEVGGCFSRCLGEMCTAVVSVPVLKDHDLAGVSVGMKNFFGGINNPNKYHHNNCDPYIADIMTHPYVRKKLRLTVCDAGLAQCEGGPAYSPKWAWRMSALLVACDPAALDAVGCDIIAGRRKELGLPTLAQAGREPTYIATAEKRGVGVADRSKLELVEL